MRCDPVSVPLVCARFVLQFVILHCRGEKRFPYGWPELNASLGLLSLNCLIVDSIYQKSLELIVWPTGNS